MNILSDCPGIKYTNRGKNNHEKKKKKTLEGKTGEWDTLGIGL